MSDIKTNPIYNRVSNTFPDWNERDKIFMVMMIQQEIIWYNETRGNPELTERINSIDDYKHFLTELSKHE